MSWSNHVLTLPLNTCYEVLKAATSTRQSQCAILTTLDLSMLAKESKFTVLETFWEPIDNSSMYS